MTTTATRESPKDVAARLVANWTSDEREFLGLMLVNGLEEAIEEGSGNTEFLAALSLELARICPLDDAWGDE